ncbi:hypothetical protein PT974_02975 [Cladobotryum mycophilum]|uniref:Hydrophobin n=1 Tax=Cladobotryum mycophilum TaxID=491253 RepID=A0ABR0T0S9_9HYPO
MKFFIPTLLALVATGFCAPTELEVGGCCVEMDGKILGRCVGFDPSEAATIARRGVFVGGCSSVKPDA